MKSFVVMTYYQLMHSVAMALTLDEKPALFFSVNYLNVEEDLLERIRETGVFQSVRGITKRGELAEFIVELNKTKDYTQEEIDSVGNSIFEKYLEPYYEEQFKDADFNDTLYIYNDFQWQQYYIDKHFNDIVGVEDGYCSLEQQLQIHRFKGDHELVNNYLGKYYPEPLYRSPKIKKIIISKYFNGIPDDYIGRIEVLDFNDLVERNKDKFSEVMLHIFNVANYEIKDDSVLFLGQPLARARYCNAAEQYLFMRKVLNEEVKCGYDVYFKAHPADVISPSLYENDAIHILPKSFPIELLNYKGCTFDKVLSFGSTGVKTMSCAKRFDKIFKNESAGFDEITNFITEYIQGQVITTDVLFLIREMNVESYIHVYSCLTKKESFDQQAFVLVEENMVEKAKAFFSKEKLSKNIRIYKKEHSINSICLWEDELKALENNIERVIEPRILVCNNPDSDDEIIASIKNINTYYDYLLVVETNDILFDHIRLLWREYRRKMASVILLQNYCVITGRKLREPRIPISIGLIDDAISTRLINRAWHRTVMSTILNSSMEEAINKLDDNIISINLSAELCFPFSRYPLDVNYEDYYVDKVNSLLGNNRDVVSETALILLEYIESFDLKKGIIDTEAIKLFVNRLNISDSEKISVLEKVCSSLYYEKRNSFKFNSGGNIGKGRFLLKRVGMSRKIVKAARVLKTVNEKIKGETKE